MRRSLAALLMSATLLATPGCSRHRHIASAPALRMPAPLLAAAGCSRNRDIPVELAPSRTTAIGVNTYLWRAAIDTLSFAPLITADSSGGPLVTHSDAHPNSPGERVKLTVSIL